MSFRKLLFFIHAFCLHLALFAQENNIPIGDWRIHSAYQTNISVELAGNKIYCANEVNAFSYDLSDGSTTILSKSNLFSDVSINKVRYNKKNDALVFGYSNGNIDILKGGSLYNISDIKRKNIIASKTINDIAFWKNYAYVCGDFGISVIDLNKYEIKESYESLAPAGMQNKVYGCTFSSDGDSIFIATERGIMTGKNSQSVNLMDFNNWFTYGPTQGIVNSKFNAIATFNNAIYTLSSDHNIYFLNSAGWHPSSLPTDDGLYSIRSSQNKLLLFDNYKFIIASKDDEYTINYPANSGTIRDGLIDNEGNIWSADYYSGLYTNRGGYYKLINPNGPLTTKINKISSFDNSILVTIGGHNSDYTSKFYAPHYYQFNNYEWVNFDRPNAFIPKYLDLINGVHNPIDKKTYFSSFGFGLLVANPDNTYKLINDTTGPFPRTLPQPGAYVKVTYTEVDKQGRVWVANLAPPSENSIHVKNTDGSWKSKNFGFAAAQFPIEILIDDNDYKWIRLEPTQGGGLIIYDDKTSSHRYITTQLGQGSLPDQSVFAYAKDRNGDVWVATGKGIAIFYNSKNLINSGEASIPIYDGFPLMYNETVTCIEVDGGNRKWIGTKNGIWLLNEDGTEVINYFTSDNSPLLSNYIIDIETNDITGEVFIGTDKGIVSYRGTATGSSKKFTDIKVFPNPVSHDYNGFISVSGLSTDVEVKITDVFGNLIYQTNAEGGTAIWKGKNYNGKRAEPGIYLIFAASSDGVEKMVGKIAVE